MLIAPAADTRSRRRPVVRLAACLTALGLLVAPRAWGQDGGWTYVVQRGDTLARLALQATGDSTRYPELRDLNPDAFSPQGWLKTGSVLTLPEGWRVPGARAPGEVDLLDGDPAVPSPGAEGRAVAPATAPPSRAATREAPQAGEVLSDSEIDAGEVPEGNLWERLTFFPALRDLEKDFETLMLRASYNADVDWGAAKIAERQARTRALLEQEILVAENKKGEAEARRRSCRQAAERARALLQKYERYDDEAWAAEMQGIATELQRAVSAEQKLWEQTLWRELSVEARRDWEDFRDALIARDWIDAWQRHADLDRHRSMLPPPPDMDQAARDVYYGDATNAALEKLLDLRSEDAYRVEQIQRKRLRDALTDVTALRECEAEFADARHFLEEKRRKLVQLQASVSAGGADALTTDARRIANRYSGILGEVQLLDAYLSNTTWSSLWWKAGVALRLAGDHDLGAQRIQQAAAVAFENRLPSGETPRSIETWLREGENEVLRTAKGLVRVLVPPEAVLTVDGRDVTHTFGEAELLLAPGVHRFVFWLDGSDPMMRLVGVAPGESHEFVWWETTELTGEEEVLAGSRPTLPALPPEKGPKRWHLGASAVAGSTLGRGVAGADVSVRYLPRFVGGELGVSVFVPFQPMWLQVGEEVVAFARIHGAVVGRGTWGRVDLVGGVGGYADPFLGAGPAARLELGVWVKPDRVRLALTGHGGWDLTPHFDEIPRWTATGGLGVWF